MTTTAPTSPNPRRRWLQFSLRTLMVVMLVFGCGFGWFAYKIKRAREQREVVKAIEKLGGYINERTTSGGVAWATVTWLGRLAGEDLASDVTMLALSETQVTDAGLEQLRGLTQLCLLDLCNTEVEAGLAHLTGLTQLESRTSVTPWSPTPDWCISVA